MSPAVGKWNVCCDIFHRFSLPSRNPICAYRRRHFMPFWRVLFLSLSLEWNSDVHRLIDERKKKSDKYDRKLSVQHQTQRTRVTRLFEAAFKIIRLTYSSLHQNKKKLCGKMKQRKRNRSSFFASSLFCHVPHSTSPTPHLDPSYYIFSRIQDEGEKLKVVGWLAHLTGGKWVGVWEGLNRGWPGLLADFFLWKEKVYVAIKTSSESLDGENWNGERANLRNIEVLLFWLNQIPSSTSLLQSSIPHVVMWERLPSANSDRTDEITSEKT